MTSISSVGAPVPYVPGGVSVKTLPQERTIPSPEKQDMSAQLSSSIQQKRTPDVVQASVKDKKDLGEKKDAKAFPDGTTVAYPEEEQLETGLVCVDGRLVQELRNPVTQEVMAQIPKKSCAKYEEMSAPIIQTPGIKVAS